MEWLYFFHFVSLGNSNTSRLNQPPWFKCSRCFFSHGWQLRRCLLWNVSMSAMWWHSMLLVFLFEWTLAYGSHSATEWECLGHGSWFERGEIGETVRNHGLNFPRLFGFNCNSPIQSIFFCVTCPLWFRLSRLLFLWFSARPTATGWTAFLWTSSVLFSSWLQLQVLATNILYMGVSKSSGTPKSWISIGFSIINHPFWGTPIFGNTHIDLTN